MFQAQYRKTKLVLEKLLCPPRSLWRRAWQDCISHHNTKPARPRPRLRPIFWSQTGLVLRPTVSGHITGLGERSQCGSGRSPDRPKIFSLFSALRMASPDIIILCYCGSKKWKILNPFNLESITVHLVMLFDVFLVHETKFTIGKWQVVIFTAGKRRGRWGGGIRHLGGVPKQCPIKTTWALAHRRN